jgi:two-component system, OmpR family, phosphate regulon sensor histidine kinase PhoR
MKKTFPLIVVLITISLLGIIFIQLSWIKNSLAVKQEELQAHISISINQVAEKIVNEKNKFAERISGPSFTTTEGIGSKDIYNTYEVKDLISKELKNEGIKIDFEFCIQDQYNRPTMASGGFKSEYFDNANTVYRPVSVNNSKQPEMIFVYFIQPEFYVHKKIYGLLVSSILFTLVIISAFALTIRTLLKQKKLSEIKNDFISNMTHEFKTPLATISLATDALKNDKVKNDNEKMEYYTDIIKEENKRMNMQVETILQAAQMEKQEIKLTLKKINIHEVINNVYENTNIQVEEKEGNLITILKATNPIIKADEVHFSNIIFNLLDNAIKYSKDKPEIKIETENIGNTVQIKFTDNGIGMSKDTLNNIFEKFYRAHTGNLHNVKGFGLGLTYVKQIVDAHHGKIKVQSALGKGSVFILAFDTIK